ncbi:hypothetical protein PVK06_027902 [Gossypium arboreum]|uniref:Uncharacterized protein n=1 Tax=Gossypium arboreum TaxID=29729 RepID=A0ABR0P3W7_GOSAR|nr:hypothetical protein PVK06_027902 [Gossypium arboreum]
METCGRSRKNRRSRDILSALEGRMINIEESMGGVKDTLKVLEGCTDKLDSMRIQFRDYVAKALSFSPDAMRETLNAAMDNQTE